MILFFCIFRTFLKQPGSLLFSEFEIASYAITSDLIQPWKEEEEKGKEKKKENPDILTSTPIKSEVISTPKIPCIG